MIEKVNPSHPDKVADRIAGALVDLAYTKQTDPKIAVEVLIGHGNCLIIAESSVDIPPEEVKAIVYRIVGTDQFLVDYLKVPQDEHLAENQSKEIRCGDNGIFKGVPTSDEEGTLSTIVRDLYEVQPSDGKFIWDAETSQFIACQSNASHEWLEQWFEKEPEMPKGALVTINPLGDWTGGTNVDTGATNRKLGSDMGRAVTGGGLHGKDLSKADVAVNIACYQMAQETGLTVEALCAIGDATVEFKREDGQTAFIPYSEVVKMARKYITKVGGFEKFAEWGLI